MHINTEIKMKTNTYILHLYMRDAYAAEFSLRIRIRIRNEFLNTQNKQTTTSDVHHIRQQKSKE